MIIESISALRSKRPVVLVDDLSARAVCYFVHAAAAADAQIVAALVDLSHGVILAPILETHAETIGLNDMMPRQQGESFTLSIEARRNVTTGISAADRAATLQALATTLDIRTDLISPGHIFPIKTRKGGVLVKTGAAEAAVDLVTMAEHQPIATMMHILDENGDFFPPENLSSDPRFKEFCSVRLSELIKYRLSKEEIIREVAVTDIPCLELGSFRTRCFVSETDGAEHVAFTRLDHEISDDRPFMVRVQSESLSTDLFPHLKGSQQPIIEKCLGMIAASGAGAFIYIRHPNASMTQAQLTPSMQSSKSSELRELGIGAQIMRKLGLSKVCLITSSSKELAGLDAFGLDVVERVSI